ncbi:hypothetical protein SERLA73DRAFT_145149, partial [Serpula lacrymans var. lacrymans S7.3]
MKHRYLRFHANPVELFLDAGLVCSGVNSGSSKEARTYRLSGNFEVIKHSASMTVHWKNSILMKI